MHACIHTNIPTYEHTNIHMMRGGDTYLRVIRCLPVLCVCFVACLRLGLCVLLCSFLFRSCFVRVVVLPGFFVAQMRESITGLPPTVATPTRYTLRTTKTRPAAQDTTPTHYCQRTHTHTCTRHKRQYNATHTAITSPNQLTPRRVSLFLSLSLSRTFSVYILDAVCWC